MICFSPIYWKWICKLIFFTDLSSQNEMYEERGHTEKEGDNLVFHWGTKQLWEQVADWGDHSLHTDKLLEKENQPAAVRPQKDSYSNPKVVTWVSAASRISIRKKQMLQNWGNGIRAAAWGKAMKTRPGPARSGRKRRSNWFRPVQRVQSVWCGTWLSHGVNADTVDLSQESKNGEDNESSNKTGPTG